MIIGKLKVFCAFAILAIVGSIGTISALPNTGSTPYKGGKPVGSLRGTAALCDQATATVDLDINNVRALLMNGGDMWWDRGTGSARYEVPKGSLKNSLYAGSIWVGGYDEQNNLKVCAQTYRQNGGNDYWPGPLDLATATISKEECSEWDKFWKINKSDLLAFNELVKGGVDPADPKYNDIKQWPASGNADAVGKSGGQLTFLQTAATGNSYAPFIDADGDGKYNWRNGDYPDIFGDQYVWWVFNDAGGVKTQTQTGTIGMEIQTSAFAYSTKNYLNDATFVNYRLINRGTLNLNRTYMATWTDADLGYGYDDYIGCDVSRSLGILYNAKTPDGNGEVTSYGAQVPMVGVDFFIGPKKDTFINGVYQILDTLGMTVYNYFNNDNTDIGNPNNGTEIYRLITGFNRVGAPLRDDRAAGSGSTGFGPGVETKFAYPGNPNNPDEWSQCQCQVPYGEPLGDRRFVHSSGPFTLYAGGIVNDITIGAVWVSDVGGCGTGTFSRIRAADDQAQTLFNDKFRTLEGPHAPDMTVREGDRELIFYLTNNNPASNNYQEKYGRDTAARYHESSGLMKSYPDSLYKFEGYRVFQLKNASITAAQIFGQNGEVDQNVAAEVWQSDIKNGVSQILNYTRNPDKGSNIFDAALKVKGADQGLSHSFRLTEDKFATGGDSRFVNYKTYHFIAIAYAYNDFRTFSYALTDSTQNTPYLESTKGAGGINNPIIHAVPNPTNGNMGTTIGADYGDGINIQQVEGLGNGRNAIQMTDSSEAVAISDPNYKVGQPVYQAGASPIDVKVVDPRKLQQLDYEIWLNGPVVDASKGIVDSLGSWTLRDKATGQVLYSETNLKKKNDAILASYGLTVTIQQGRRPSDDQVDGNGYITSSVTFSDPGKLWLAGINDVDGPTPQDWIRSGTPGRASDTTTNGCTTANTNRDTVAQFYESLFKNNDLLRATWAPYALASQANLSKCGFGVAKSGSSVVITGLQSVDVVFTSDKSKWTRSPVVEMNDDVNLAQGSTPKYRLRRHRGWNLQLDGNGNPVYSSDPADSGMSWFPGYAVNQSTGERLNIVFGEDSYLKDQNGNDMIWNPTSSIFDANNNVLFAGKHYVYVLSTAYDKGKGFADTVKNYSNTQGFIQSWNRPMWVGLPRLTPGFSFNSLNDGLIPTETRLSFRVEGTYRRQADTSNARNGGLPIFGFSTKGIAPKAFSDAGNTYNNDKQALLDKIRMVPNPYYAYAGYERNRLDTRVKITNLPNRATISIYSLDGTLIRKIEHVSTEATTQGFEDWDIRNAKGLQIASGMYLVHVKAEGIGETVIKWFGAMRPTDITTY